MYVLFVLSHSLYLRYYDSVIASLAERGHPVSLVWSKASKKHERLEARRATFRLGPPVVT